MVCSPVVATTGEKVTTKIPLKLKLCMNCTLSYIATQKLISLAPIYQLKTRCMYLNVLAIKTYYFTQITMTRMKISRFAGSTRVTHTCHLCLNTPNSLTTSPETKRKNGLRASASLSIRRYYIPHPIKPAVNDTNSAKSAVEI